MLTYDTLARKPSAFKSMTGLTVQEFEALLADLRPRYEGMRQEERAASPHVRAGQSHGACFSDTHSVAPVNRSASPNRSTEDKGNADDVSVKNV